VRAPTRALVVEDIESWAFTLARAARRAGASEVVVCASPQQVQDALRIHRFDVAILDIGLDPDDDLNADGVTVLEMIRKADGGSTRCILVTGWQGGDRMALQAEVHLEHGIDFAYMKEKYEARTVIAKLSELLERAPERRLAQDTPMDNLSAKMDPPFVFDNMLLAALKPTGGVQTLYSLASRLIGSVTPLIAWRTDKPLETGSDGVCAGVYWSRALGSAVGVTLAPAAAWSRDDNGSPVPASLAHMLPTGVTPDLIESVRERNVAGGLWELPGLERDEFPG